MPLSIHHSKRGFTLTELTICVLIVFVLGLVLFPVFARSHGRSPGATCGSNQKEIVLGFLQYLQDYDERFPPAVSHIRADEANGTLTQSWGPDYKLKTNQHYVTGILSPYVKSNQVFEDPDLSAQGRGSFILDYMYNDLLANVKLDQVAAASLTVVTTDAENRFANAGHALTLDSGPYAAVFNQKGGCDAGQGATIGKARLRHHNGANFSFTDGHVKWFKGGSSDSVFFPPRDSASISAIDPKTKQQIGPQPGKGMTFNGRTYSATYHIR